MVGGVQAGAGPDEEGLSVVQPLRRPGDPVVIVEHATQRVRLPLHRFPHGTHGGLLSGPPRRTWPCTVAKDPNARRPDLPV